MTTRRRKYTREKRFPCRLSFTVTEATEADLIAAADAAGVSLAQAARETLLRGLQHGKKRGNG